ncbi:MAG: flagellar biosynthesis protein FliQ [Gaiellales bacterium]
MNGDVAIHLTTQAALLGFKLALPFLAASLVVGLAISVVQAATQIQEMTLTFVPKIVVTGIVMLIAGPWMLDQISAYTTELFREIPQLTGP